MDMRRSNAVEAISGDVGEPASPALLPNGEFHRSLECASAFHKTGASVDTAELSTARLA
jgi:hypothetical protein